MSLSIYTNAYLAKAKKFEVTASEGKNGVMLEINVYDVIKIEMTPEQWTECFEAISKFTKKGGGKPAARRDDDY